jgi:hypothetical protein
VVPAGGRWWDYFPGEGAPGRDHDEFPVPGADREGPGVRLLEKAQHVGRLLAVSRSWAPADHDPLADIGAGQPDLQPVPHAGHLLAGQAARAAGQPAGRSSTQSLPSASVRGPATTHVMGGSTSPWLPARCACRLGAAGPVRWLGVLLLAADVGHFRLPAHLVAAGLAGAPLGVAVGAPGPDAGDVLAQRLVAGTCAQQAGLLASAAAS